MPELHDPDAAVQAHGGICAEERIFHGILGYLPEVQADAELSRRDDEIDWRSGAETASVKI